MSVSTLQVSVISSSSPSFSEPSQTLVSSTLPKVSGSTYQRVFPSASSID